MKNIRWNFNNWMPGDKKVKQHLIPSVKAKAKKPWAFNVLGDFVPLANPVTKIYRDGKYWNKDEWDKLSVFESGSKFAEKLETKGFQRAGSGYYSQVFSHPKADKVIKVSRKQTDYEGNTSYDSWIDYALWGSKYGYAGGFAPKVYSYKDFGNFYVATMEKLEYTLTGTTVEENPDASCIEFLFRQSVEMNNPTARRLCDSIAPQLGDFGDNLRTAFGNGRLDLHGGNIMYRKDGTVCVTDPVCHKSTLQHKRLRSRDFSPSSLDYS